MNRIRINIGYLLLLLVLLIWLWLFIDSRQRTSEINKTLEELPVQPKAG